MHEEGVRVFGINQQPREGVEVERCGVGGVSVSTLHVSNNVQ